MKIHRDTKEKPASRENRSIAMTAIGDCLASYSEEIAPGLSTGGSVFPPDLVVVKPFEFWRPKAVANNNSLS